MKYRILIGLMLMTCTWVSAQNDTPRRWALDAHAGGVRPIPSHTDGVGISSLSSIGIPDSHSGLLTKLHAEYYIPFSPFSVKGGYEHEEMGLLGGDAYADVNQLMLGGRYYNPMPVSTPTTISVRKQSASIWRLPRPTTIWITRGKASSECLLSVPHRLSVSISICSPASRFKWNTASEWASDPKRKSTPNTIQTPRSITPPPTTTDILLP